MTKRRAARLMLAATLMLAACGRTKPAPDTARADTANDASIGDATDDSGAPPALDLMPESTSPDNRDAPDEAQAAGDGADVADQRLICDEPAACVPPVCVLDTDCGRLNHCNGGRCAACHPSCVVDADCVTGARCFDRNGCTYCALPDASAPG